MTRGSDATLQLRIKRSRNLGSSIFIGAILWALAAPMLARCGLISHATADGSVLAIMSAVAIIITVLWLKQLPLERQLANQILVSEIEEKRRPAKAALADQHLGE